MILLVNFYQAILFCEMNFTKKFLDKQLKIVKKLF
jgi:hypothetical protein